mgnify:CR=1 FL=1
MGGAALVSPELIDGAAEVFGATVLNLFGQTELAPVLSMTRPGDTRADRLATVGRPLPQVECKIVDPVSGAVAAVGEPGDGLDVAGQECGLVEADVHHERAQGDLGDVGGGH